MNDRLDPDLTQLFDATPSLEPGGFALSVARAIHRARRLRRMISFALCIAVLALAVYLTPTVASGSVIIARWALAGFPTFSQALVSPVGAACSLLFGFWCVLRLRRRFR